MDLWTRYCLLAAAAIVVAVIALGVAADAGGGSLYGFALIVFGVAVILAFRVVNAYFDAKAGRSARILPGANEITPATFEGSLAAGGGTAVVAVIGLSLAAGAGSAGFTYDLGIAVFVGAVLYAFLLIKHRFDKLE